MGQTATVQQAVQQAVSESLGSIQRQLAEVQSSYQQVQKALETAGNREGAERFVALLPSLMHMQTAGTALAASVESVLRFVGASAGWAAGVSVVAPAEPAAITAERAQPPAETPAEEIPEAVVEEAEAEPTVEVEPAPPVEEAAPQRVDVAMLPDDLQQLHKRAARYARIAVQEFVLYKRAEVEKGRQNRDLYQRFRDEIDKTKTEYDRKFQKIADHNIDYLYDELVRVLAQNDPGALGNYPYPTPAQR